MECHVKKNDHFLHLFAFNQGSKAEKLLITILVISTNKVLKTLLNIGNTGAYH